MSSSPATASTNTGPRRIRRQQRSIEEKRRIVEATLEPDRSVTEVARAHGVRANQVFKWRRLYRDGRMNGGVDEATLLPVRITKPCKTVIAKLSDRGVSSGTIQIEFRSARVSVEGRVDLPTLQAVLEHLSK
ncbi:MAG TPA: transposase [Bryobacteraceae bacterium]